MITEKEKQAYELFQKLGTYLDVAKELGLSKATVEGRVSSFETKKRRLTNTKFDELRSATKNILAAAGVYSLEDVMTKNMAFFENLPNFGKRSRLELLNVMESSGYNVDGILKKDWSKGEKIDDKCSIVFTINMTPSQRSKLESLGGAEWIRKQISAA